MARVPTGPSTAKREQRMVRLPPDLHDELKLRAQAHDLSTAQALRRAVRSYIRELDGVAP